MYYCRSGGPASSRGLCGHPFWKLRRMCVLAHWVVGITQLLGRSADGHSGFSRHLIPRRLASFLRLPLWPAPLPSCPIRNGSCDSAGLTGITQDRGPSPVTATKPLLLSKVKHPQGRRAGAWTSGGASFRVESDGACERLSPARVVWRPSWRGGEWDLDTALRECVAMAGCGAGLSIHSCLFPHSLHPRDSPRRDG